MTQLTLSVAVTAFKEATLECPMAPHTKKEGFTGKAAKEKDVAKLRSSMEKGRSTRQWLQDESDSEKFTKDDNFDASKKPEPKFDKDPIEILGETYPLSIAAHHLIPGKASLPVSELKKYLWKGSVVDSDVGYDVDGAENGKWLPTHQTMSSKLGKSQAIVIEDEVKPSSTVGMSWGALSDRAKEHAGNAVTYSQLFLPRYTQQAMDVLNAQFHDAHSDYSTYVTDKLNKLAVRMAVKSGMCDECKKVAVKSPPYMLVYWLNSVSSSLDRTLSGKPKKKWSTVYTSKFSCMYQETPIDKDNLGK